MMNSRRTLIATVKVFDNNLVVRETLECQRQSQVLVIDGGEASEKKNVVVHVAGVPSLVAQRYFSNLYIFVCAIEKFVCLYHQTKAIRLVAAKAFVSEMAAQVSC